MLNIFKKYFGTKEYKISENFKNYYIKCFNFDNCEINIEKYENYNPESLIVHQLIEYNKVEKLSSETIKKYFLQVFGVPKKNRKLVSFIFSRKTSNNLFFRHFILGYFIEKDKIYFPNYFNDLNFNFYKFSGSIPNFSVFYQKQNNILNQSQEFEQYISMDSFYFYYLKDNNFKCITHFPLIEKNKNQLFFQLKDKKEFCSDKLYSLEITTKIDSNNFCSNSIISLYLNGKSIKEKEYKIYNTEDFYLCLEEFLFPYYLSNESKKQLNLENISLDDIERNFDNEYNIYKIANL